MTYFKELVNKMLEFQGKYFQVEVISFEKYLDLTNTFENSRCDPSMKNSSLNDECLRMMDASKRDVFFGSSEFKDNKEVIVLIMGNYVIFLFKEEFSVLKEWINNLRGPTSSIQLDVRENQYVTDLRFAFLGKFSPDFICRFSIVNYCKDELVPTEMIEFSWNINSEEFEDLRQKINQAHLKETGGNLNDTNS